MTNKTEADNLLSIDVGWLNKHGYFVGLKSGSIQWSNGFSDEKSSIGIVCSVVDSPYIKLKYTQTDNYSGEKKALIIKCDLFQLNVIMVADDGGLYVRSR